ncbi:molybdopterin oxidoreductase [Litorilinea aerophila]|uniref:4Fe-4S dicluster domain-containing protein n=1 Tax=Litorilinea aerophila TaxID=1204385 RepID=A0A540VKC3_9CHLR|nr:TAT-variant-translocated molybdopterin oxidoreductase [Litorilinea aerophila]OUC04956.1 molybdopterin oxidoreductase [Litorilinea aerophila]
MDATQFDWNTLRQRLAQNPDRKAFWRSLEELADTPAFQALLRQEFPQMAIPGPTTSRRTFLKLMGAALLMAGCSVRPPRRQIVPYVNAPETVIPGKPLYFATAMPLGGYGIGVLVESHEGRPTKVEGNPQHPASLGGSNPFLQASILGLYDPDRAQVVTEQGQIRTWQDFLNALQARRAGWQETQGAGLRILTGTITSPTLGAQLQALLEAFPQARWYQYEPAGLDNLREGARLAFGRVLNTVYHVAQAARILSLDADFLYTFPGSIRHARDFAAGRRLRDGAADTATMNRLYAVESTPTITGARADHRLPLQAAQVEAAARLLARELGLAVPEGTPGMLDEAQAAWLAAAARDLQEHAGASLIVAGETQPPAVHALAHAMNLALGNVGNTVTYTEPVEVEPSQGVASLGTLVEELQAGQVDALIVVDCNPVLTAPADFDFAAGLEQVAFSVALSPYLDETAARCTWHVPATHYLEMWGDVRAYDGTVTILQPLIAPLFDGRSPHELLAALIGQPQSGYDVVRRQWDAYYQAQEQPAQPDAESFWRTCLHDGVVAGTALPPVEVQLRPDWADALPTGPTGPTEGLELIFRPDTAIWDGRFANNAWLQELPRHLTTLTWDNAGLISPGTAARLGLSTGDLVRLEHQGRRLEVPVYVMPGHPDEAMTLHLGYGRPWAGQVSQDVGFNAYLLRTSEGFWHAQGVQLQKLNRRYPLATTQNHFLMEGRELVRSADLEHYRQDPAFAHHEHDEHEQPSLYPPYPYEGHAWGMVIDLTACIGCNACTIACQMENNIPVVGKENVAMGREMHWLKVDQYFSGPPENPTVHFQPRPCMHCERAPCEPVCPVEATVHDAEGLNEMIYNRCVGTRYCSNNCPYKVRRFNFFDYVPSDESPLLQMWRNPDVTVRNRGVMEKCTYCIQRINAARIEAQKEGRPIGPGEILTACQQACPTQAIVFGDINAEEDPVARLKEHPLNYTLLAELGTRPRTSYLAEVRNPNPALSG